MSCGLPFANDHQLNMKCDPIRSLKYVPRFCGNTQLDVYHTHSATSSPIGLGTDNSSSPTKPHNLGVLLTHHQSTRKMASLKDG